MSPSIIDYGKMRKLFDHAKLRTGDLGGQPQLAKVVLTATEAVMAPKSPDRAYTGGRRLYAAHCQAHSKQKALAMVGG